MLAVAAKRDTLKNQVWNLKVVRTEDAHPVFGAAMDGVFRVGAVGLTSDNRLLGVALWDSTGARLQLRDVRSGEVALTVPDVTWFTFAPNGVTAALLTPSEIQIWDSDEQEATADDSPWAI